MPGRRLHGIVSSNATDKTVKVKVERRVLDPVYKKYLKRTSSYLAHDEKNSCKLGDNVVIEECRPVSKRKTWTIVEQKL